MNVKAYPPKSFSGDYVSSPQNVGIIQSPSGLMYFANGSGVLEFDGFYWRMVEGTAGLGPRAFALDPKGTIYVGGKGDLGYLAPDSTGRLAFKSLLILLSEADREFGTVFFAIGLGDEIIFLSKEQVMRYKDNQMQAWHAESIFSAAYVVDGVLYLKQENTRLVKLNADGIEAVVPATGELSDWEAVNYFKTLCPCDKPTREVVVKNNNNYFLFNGGAELIKINDNVSDFLNSQRGVEKTARTSDGKIAIGTLSGGVIVIDGKGDFVDLINTEDGIPDNIANAIYIDAADGLWIGHDRGISRTQLNSPLSFIDQRSGYTGFVVSVKRFNGRLYISTTDGVYVQKEAGFLMPVSFERIMEIENQAFKLLESNNRLLVATVHGIYQIEGTRAKKIADGIATDLFRSKENGNLVFAAMNNAIVPLELINGNWNVGKALNGIKDIIYRGITEKGDIIWASNFTDKLYRLDFANSAENSTVVFDTSDALPSGWVEPFLIDDEIYFGTLLGVFQFDRAQNRFTRTSDKRFEYFNERLQEAGPVRTDPYGNIWVVSRGKAGKIIPDASGGYQWDSTACMEIPATSIWSIYFDENEVTWLGATDFLVRYDAKVKRNNLQNFQTCLRKVVLAEDSLLFMGAGGYALHKIKYKHNSLDFEFAAPFYEGENSYSVILEGYDARWSGWSKGTKIRYTNLGPGNYTFRVKAKNIYELQGAEAAYSFSVLPPFYLTIWAFAAYALLLGLAIWGIVAWNQRRLVRSKEQLEKIVEKRTEELVMANNELKKAKEFEEQFLANMSHEIRTPMISVAGLTDLLMKSGLSPKHTQYLRVIKQSADNMLVIINDILDISKIQSGKLEMKAADFSVREAIDGVLNIMHLLIEEKKLKVSADISPDVPDFVTGDPVRLHEIILNLVNNAVKFTEKGGITITCRVKEKTDSSLRLEFGVEDTGRGIPPDKLESVFTGREITKEFGGSGLGLTICKKLIELQNGKISVQSAVNKGSLFLFDILYGISRQMPATKAAPEPDDLHFENLSILLVENHAFNRMVVMDTLGEFIKNARIDIAENGEEAVRLVSANDYDLVLMDLLMPVMNGYEAVKKIRTELPHPKNKVRIMAMSACATKQENYDCLAAGMDDYLAKPFGKEELVHKIAGLVEIEKIKTGKRGKVVNLDLLERMTEGDEAKKAEYLNIYLLTAPSLFAQLDKAVKETDWKSVRESAHSLIPQFHYIGASSLKETAEEIERKAKSKERLDEIAMLADELGAGMNRTYAELNDLQREKKPKEQNI